MTEDNQPTEEENTELENSEISKQTSGAEELEATEQDSSDATNDDDAWDALVKETDDAVVVEPEAETKDVEPTSTPEVVAEEEHQEEEEEEVYDPRRWFSLRVISGKERKIKERIEFEIDRSNWNEFVTQILVPSEKVYKIRNGKKVILERNILPGYILVQAIPEKLTGEVAIAIANLPNVIHFLGRENPVPMQQSEANRMLGIVDDSQEVGEAMMEPYIVGETVKIIDGPFNEFVGDIQEVNEEKKKLKVIVKIFGRGTEVELNFMQVEKQP
jgi:transcriptional antiterminator NusG